MVQTIFLVCLALLLGGCVADPANRAAVIEGTRIEADRHTGWVNAYGPAVLRFTASDALWYSYLVRTRLDRGASERGKPFQVLVQAMFAKRVYLDHAYAAGEPLDTTVIDRERMREGTKETIAINLTADEMAAYARSGLAFRILGRRAQLEVDIPAAYLAAVLDCHLSVAQAVGRTYAEVGDATLGCQAGA